MLLREFYTGVVHSEETATQYLLQHGLLVQENSCRKCDGPVMLTNKKVRGQDVPVWRCRRKGCQSVRSVRKGNEFFHYTNMNGRLHCNLKLCEILELVYIWSIKMPMEEVPRHTGRSTNTVVDWFNYCREVCSEMVSVTRRGKLRGTPDDPIQIDEARFAGRRKYNRGRLLAGDEPAEENIEDPVQNHRNHGSRIDGPWVFGLCQGTDVRYFYINKRDAATLIPIIEREVEAGSTIHSDEWPAYRRLQQAGYDHKTVNHQKNYVDPNTGAHTQQIERSWLDSKIDILKKKRGVPQHHLQGHLDEYCWRVSQGEEDHFLAILRDIKKVFI